MDLTRKRCDMCGNEIDPKENYVTVLDVTVIEYGRRNKQRAVYHVGCYG